MAFSRYERSLSIHQRFWSRVDRQGQHDCWPWLRGTDGCGYGKFLVKAGELESDTSKEQKANRVAFRLAHGRWPEPMALHGCDNPLCCNPYSPIHIHEGDQALNMQERFLRNRQGAHMMSGETHATAKFTNEQVRAIRERYAQGGVLFTELAQEFGVSHTCISFIVRRKTYANVQ